VSVESAVVCDIAPTRLSRISSRRQNTFNDELRGTDLDELRHHYRQCESGVARHFINRR